MIRRLGPLRFWLRRQVEEPIAGVCGGHRVVWCGVAIWRRELEITWTVPYHPRSKRGS